MKVGLVIPIFNRSAYVRQALHSLKRTPHPLELYLVNDGSTEDAAMELFNQFKWSTNKVTKVRNVKNQNMFTCLSEGWQQLINDGCEILMNLDSDAIVKEVWIDRLLELQARFPTRIISGFNASSHPAVECCERYVLKNTIGGINMMFGSRLYPLIKDCLVDDQWDWHVCGVMQKLGRPFVVSRPSVVQHLGRTGLHSGKSSFDVASDF